MVLSVLQVNVLQGFLTAQACTVKAEVATESTRDGFKSASRDSLSQQKSQSLHGFDSGKCCSADNYGVFVSMYYGNALCTSHPRAKQLLQTVDNGFVMFQSPCR
jgi:hypothetical protein